MTELRPCSSIFYGRPDDMIQSGIQTTRWPL